jgi:hypothetical protein
MSEGFSLGVLAGAFIILIVLGLLLSFVLDVIVSMCGGKQDD